jgi:hypothetical protein
VLPSAIDDEPAINIFRLLEYWGKEPPTHVILALRYLGQHKKPTTEDEAAGQMHQLAGMVEQNLTPMPQHLREMAQWAEEEAAKLNRRGKKNGRKS